MAIYLDYNATTPINSDVLECMIDVYKNNYGNANSRTHDFGANANKIVANSRKKVADLLNVKSDEVFFTSGATESNNIAIQGLIKYGKANNKKHIITSSIEHHSVLHTMKHLEEEGFSVDYVNPQSSGRIDYKEVLSLVREDTLLVSIMHVNNETGIIQPVKEIGEGLKDSNVFFHIDATQSAGKLVKEIQELSYDMLSLSAHKFSGPQGIGVLVLRKKRYTLPPVKGIMFGGEQEHKIRPGTLPVALIAGIGKAAEIALENYSEEMNSAIEIKKIVMNLINESGLKYRINGCEDYCIPTTINLCLEGVSSEALMVATKQYCGISNGSACTSHSYAPSFVLKAMGIPEDLINNSIRLSWGPNTDISELKEMLFNLLEIAKGLVF